MEDFASWVAQPAWGFGGFNLVQDSNRSYHAVERLSFDPVYLAQTIRTLEQMPALPPPTTPRFPAVISKDLNGRLIVLPRDLPAERTIILIGWQRQQQSQLDTWIHGLQLGHGPLPWLEVPVIEPLGAPVRWFIGHGMRSGIANHEAWSHVVTLYLPKSPFDKTLGVTSEDAVQVLVVTRGGELIERVTGPFTTSGAARLQRAMAPGAP